MDELKKELEQDKAFIEKVVNRIYLDTDDIEESMPDPEWIDRMTDIADKYITRFETSFNFANNLADELLASNIQLNDDQKIVLEYLKSKITESSVNPISAIVILGHLWEFRRLNTEEERRVLEAYWQLNSKQQVEVLQVFSAWFFEQEEDHNGIN